MIRRGSDFNPLDPWGSRQFVSSGFENYYDISIHSTRGGRDRGIPNNLHLHINFNPLDPWGSRRSFISAWAFQYTHFNPLDPWGSRHRLFRAVTRLSISIHSTRGGRDTARQCRHSWMAYFNPLDPWGSRPYSLLTMMDIAYHFNPLDPWGSRPVMTKSCRSCT